MERSAALALMLVTAALALFAYGQGEGNETTASVSVEELAKYVRELNSTVQKINQTLKGLEGRVQNLEADVKRLGDELERINTTSWVNFRRGEQMNAWELSLKIDQLSAQLQVAYVLLAVSLALNAFAIYLLKRRGGEVGEIC